MQLAKLHAATWSRAALTAACVRLLQLAALHLSSQQLPDYDTSAPLGARACSAHAADAAPLQHCQDAGMVRHGALLDVPNGSQWQAAQWTWKLVVWDSVFFTDVACNGYQYEQQYAFFPLLPALMRAIATVTSLPLPACGLLISAAASILSAPLMLQLTTSVTGDPQLAAAATLFLSLNPASIFHAAIYTEALFTLLSLAGLCCLYVGSGLRRPFVAWSGVRFAAAAACFSLASCTRSNGIVSAGFLLHAALHQIVQSWATFCAGFVKPQRPAPGSRAAVGAGGAGSSSDQQPARQHLPLSFLPGPLKAAVVTVVWGSAGLVGAAAVAAPLFLHQAHAAASFCGQQHTSLYRHLPVVVQQAMSAVWGPVALHGSIGQTEVNGRLWCTASWWRLSAYGFVQRQYWGVGFLEYWKLQQIPNFLLAAPVLAISLCGLWTYVSAHPRVMATGGLLLPVGGSSHPGPGTKQHTARQPCPGTAGTTTTDVGSGGDSAGSVRTLEASQCAPNKAKAHTAGGSAKQGGFLAPPAAVFMYPWAFMAACALLVMHVQVATRFLSSTPPLYWYMAHLWLRSQRPSQHHQGHGSDDPATGCHSSEHRSGMRTKKGRSSVDGRAVRRSERLAGKGAASGSGADKEGSVGPRGDVGNKQAVRQQVRGNMGLPIVGSALWVWCFVYMAAGFVLFPNFYPWT